SQRVLEMRHEDHSLRKLVDAAVGLLGEKEKADAAAWALDMPTDLQAHCDAELTKRALRALLERMARASEGPLFVLRQQTPNQATLWIGRRDKAQPAQLIPPPPEEQAGDDADGSVLGYELARTVMEAHGGALEERDDGLWLSLPQAAA